MLAKLMRNEVKQGGGHLGMGTRSGKTPLFNSAIMKLS
jgi:hypothetical protein